MDRTQFEKLAERAIQELPAEFRKKLENVVVIIEDEPPEELGDSVFGLYEGTPLTQRGSSAPLLPDQIFIFQRPIEEECNSEDEIKEEIQITIVHEIAHFFGMDDDYLEELGY